MEDQEYLEEMAAAMEDPTITPPTAPTRVCLCNVRTIGELVEDAAREEMAAAMEDTTDHTEETEATDATQFVAFNEIVKGMTHGQMMNRFM